jgi:hypothetical protein
VTHFVYLDEAGISAGEPISVVAGPIVDTRRALSIQEYMRSTLARLLKPETLPDNFVISAKDLFHGTKCFKDEAMWPTERRFDILHQILAIPRLFNLAAVVGWWRRDVTEEEAFVPRDRVIMAHSRAFVMAAIPIQRFMVEETGWDSCATIIAENNNETRSAIRSMQRKLRSRRYVDERLDPQLRPHLPLTKVLEDPLFTDKGWSNLLLMADACAFSLTRWYTGRSGASALLDTLMRDTRPVFPSTHQAGHQFFKFEPLLSRGPFVEGDR